MRERSPVPCAQPSPRGDAPSPLAFAKSCKGGDVSVLDPALAWDVRCIYLFTHTHTWGLGGCSTPHLSRSLGERRRGRKRANPKVRYALPASPPPGGATYSSCPSPCAPCALSRRAPPPVGRSGGRKKRELERARGSASGTVAGRQAVCRVSGSCAKISRRCAATRDRPGRLACIQGAKSKPDSDLVKSIFFSGSRTEEVARVP